MYSTLSPRPALWVASREVYLVAIMKHMENHKLTLVISMVVLISGVIIAAIFEIIQLRNEVKDLKTGIQTFGNESSTAVKELVNESSTAEIEQLRNEVESLKRNSVTPKTNVAEITAEDIKPFITGVQEITCGSLDSGITRGSGSLWEMSGSYFVLTNYHVISRYSCYFAPTDDEGIGIGDFKFSYSDITTPTGAIRKANDFALLGISIHAGSGWAGTQLDTSELNYRISETRFCPMNISINSPVAVLGYPSYAMQQIHGGWLVNRVVSNGVISGRTIDQDYYVSAKIDAGNSGGIALSKDNKGICVLGVPTELSIGQYETQGIVKNIYKAF